MRVRASIIGTLVPSKNKEDTTQNTTYSSSAWKNLERKPFVHQKEHEFLYTTHDFLYRHVALIHTNARHKSPSKAPQPTSPTKSLGRQKPEKGAPLRVF